MWNAVRAVARYAHAPKHVHWKVALSILQHLRTTNDRSYFSTRFGLNLEAFADADCANKADDLRSVSGGIVMCGGPAVSWFARTQKCVTISITGATYHA